ncbi:aminotransferase class I/II-fold pyridoxal phosphate-dependent enzyme [Zunongwangia endophytica]|uniref:Aminotransferase class I/II-fold pyridoxal phosphate-dependent enzyme n=1 Tax=Zunongwangia endophytica TaxID=1808945 RepID=A0ABV8HE22_9FLAO|nr:aminotransferase class I/II-fold pyridoxal phosphate-dependent enzyme [Zunongwangia endophytica]MDN3594386.1 aminotransferase class I/II-fold pyridoxal phosphate-dependent enzyme [Zunongwangia endophytica]
MAKIKHNNFLDTVDDYFLQAQEKGILHLYAEDKSLTGRFITVKGKSLYHFGTTGYLGLEQDQRLKAEAIEGIKKYGTQFPLSKTYISHPLYAELETSLKALFNSPVIITKNSTLGHIGVIPGLVQDQDAVILDHQVHWSVHNAVQLLKPRGISVKMIPHNDSKALEELIKDLKGTHEKIWFFADGIYSMFGDCAPIADLFLLLEKYSQLHLYFDDVHGMSWTGTNGAGFILQSCEELGFSELPDRVMFMATLSKTFGANGSVFICPNEELHRKLKLYGGPLTFSAQLDPASVAAAIASAKIHLSDEIKGLQDELKGKIKLCSRLLKDTALPIVNLNNTPVFYIACGLPITGYEMIERLFKKGFFVNLGLFPAVPVKNTGIRFTISRHNNQKDIRKLVKALAEAFEEAIIVSDSSRRRIAELFKNYNWNASYIKQLEKESKSSSKSNLNSNLVLQCFKSIDDIDKEEWNTHIGHGLFDFSGQQWLEKVLSASFMDESGLNHKTNFFYFRIVDQSNRLVLLTYFSLERLKDDMLAPESVSIAYEKQRMLQPDYMTSRVLSMGSIFSEGKHFYADVNHSAINDAWRLLFKNLEELKREKNGQMILLRDFPDDHIHEHLFKQQGFIKIGMPRSCKMLLADCHSIKEWFSKLSKRNRRHFRVDIEPYLKDCELVISQEATKDLIHQYYVLYQNVQKENIAINLFPYPEQLFFEMNTHPAWEFLELRTRDKEGKLLGVVFCYTSKECYSPALIGIDYNYNASHAVYRQLLYYIIQQGIAKNVSEIDLGLSAAFEKRKLGANIYNTYAYLQSDDNFKLDVLELTQNE